MEESKYATLNDKSVTTSDYKETKSTRNEHVSKFLAGGFSFQQENHANLDVEEGRDQSTEERREQLSETSENTMKTVVNNNANDNKKGAMRFVPSFLSNLPKTRDVMERRRSVACTRDSRSSSVDSRSQSVSRPIFSFLRGSEDNNPHRTRQGSNLTSRRNSVTSLKKYASQDYLNTSNINNLKIRNNPVLLAQPGDGKDDPEGGFLNKDGSLYMSNENLTSSVSRSRHRSGSQNRDSSYTWSGRAQLSGTGLRVGSSVTEPEPRDGLALSRDGAFFMPFGNTENLSGKCKTRRQLKAEEQLRKQQEEEEESERERERERRRTKRQEKRNRNRTVSMSACNRNILSNSSSNNNNISINNNMMINCEENTRTEHSSVNNSSSTKILTEIENIEIFKKSVDQSISTTTTSVKTEDETKTETQAERDVSWQRFGAEYNEFGELIGCGKEPVGGHDGHVWSGEKRDRSGAFWEVGEEYQGLVDGYGNRISGEGGKSGRWDNVRKPRDPILHVSQDPDFVPDRSFISCSREPLTGFGSTTDLSKTESRGRKQNKENLSKMRCASLDTRSMVN